MRCQTDEDFGSVVSDMADWLIDQGVTRIHQLTAARRLQLVKDLIRHQVYYRYNILYAIS